MLIEKAKQEKQEGVATIEYLQHELLSMSAEKGSLIQLLAKIKTEPDKYMYVAVASMCAAASLMCPSAWLCVGNMRKFLRRP